jgi:uncharacterized membrane protein
MSEGSLTTSFWLWQFLGRLHPLVVHFPIGLLVVALILEFYSGKKKNQDFLSGKYVILLIGTLGAIAAAAFGLLLKDQDDYVGNSLAIHQWSGIITALLSVGTFYFFHLSLRRSSNIFPTVYRTLLIFTVLAVTIAGHYGSSLTHGSNYLTEVLPWNSDSDISGNPDFNLTSLTNDSSSKELNPSQIADLNLEVRSIFAHNCYKCHSEEKTKGQLRLDRKELVMRGGKSGKVIEPGHPEKSELIRRLLLPRTDKKSMPTNGKALSRQEIATLEFWIKLGAPWPANSNERSIYRVAELAPRKPPIPHDDSGLANPIDRFVNSYFEVKKISWPTVVIDKIFIRRVFLDIIGLLPSPKEVDYLLRTPTPLNEKF